ncbi:MAG: type II CRISPR-associated endonuclease Cas1 [Clostridiales bacterium]|jgi:CRISPR-associated endonuclease Cas1 subtype II|nr:type II CRISPR-associated endonuclease Cas1 [Clostridiales bacterium]
MPDNAWRTVLIDKNVDLTYSTGNLIVKGDVDKHIPLCDIRTVIINSLQVTLTAYLLNELRKNKIKVIFCDEKYNPCSEIVSAADNCLAPQRLSEQCRWQKKVKRLLWSRIVRQKIKIQAGLLDRLNIARDNKLDEYLSGIKPGDKSNREGQAARIYFNALFGAAFNRREESHINSALNYGYAILLSEANRTIAGHGYNLSLGIMHRGATNNFNLSCDIIEPFRPFVDRIVVENNFSALDKELKRKLICVTNSQVKYNGKITDVKNALDGFFLSAADSLNSGKINVGEVEFI